MDINVTIKDKKKPKDIRLISVNITVPAKTCEITDLLSGLEVFEKIDSRLILGIREILEEYFKQGENELVSAMKAKTGKVLKLA